jgi:hypothetical protein
VSWVLGKVAIMTAFSYALGKLVAWIVSRLLA